MSLFCNKNKIVARFYGTRRRRSETREKYLFLQPRWTGIFDKLQGITEFSPKSFGFRHRNFTKIRILSTIWIHPALQAAGNSNLKWIATKSRLLIVWYKLLGGDRKWKTKYCQQRSFNKYLEVLETVVSVTCWLWGEGSAVFKHRLILPLRALKFIWLRKDRASAGIWPSLTRLFPPMTAPCEFFHLNWSRSAGIQI